MRLVSLDVFRGMTIAAMILANMAGVADNVYAPLNHAEWHGCTFTDLVFPSFLFIVGVAMSFSLAKYHTGEKPKKSVYVSIFKRTIILCILGLFLNGFWNKGVWTFNFESLRFMGVLQRIGLTYCFASLVVLHLKPKYQWILAAGLLVIYWVTMMYIPVPDHGAGVLTREGNFGAFIDRLVISKPHLYKGDGFNYLGDPDGLYSTIPAIVSVLFGVFAGEWLKKQQEANSKISMDLVLFGLCCLVLGIMWDAIFPMNKKLWTSSYVLFTSGWALLVLAGCYEMVEVRLKKDWFKPFEVMGVNAIALFVASVLLIKVTTKTQLGTGDNAISIYNWIYENVFASWSGKLNGSLLFALVTLLLWYGVAVVMYQKKWFIKV
ncbi:DUF5009 domain-containing protein [Anabaena sp. FACHB-1237]|uniref:acyltransferase family protein n=1 Tax=Anabaena sp. FACHB-1237 TaxID=2692769 RepID=UPI0016812407|nr:DUF5009 domain-containing protein [Anabaena sp. FACHB-1237]MBD2137665.1 DUF5009 domain-containing protein [Anabaena sp. FACHB-1237]